MAQQTEVQWTGKTGGGNFGQRFVLGCLKSVKVTVLYPVLPLVVPVYCVVNHKAFGCIYRYFKEIHHYSGWKSFWKTIQNHLIFGQVVLDRFAVLAGNTEQFHLEIENEDILDRLLDQPGGFIIAGSHIGHFELTGHCIHQNKKQVNAVVFGGEGAVIKQHRSNSFMQNNIRLVPVTEDLSHLFILDGAIADGEIVSLPADRPFGSRKVLRLPFLGREAAFPAGPFTMAVRRDVKGILAAYAIKEARRKYRIILDPIAMPAEGSDREKALSLASQYVSSLEKVARRWPGQWYNFYYFWQ